jgi:hypothetical protein
MAKWRSLTSNRLRNEGYIRAPARSPGCVIHAIERILAGEFRMKSFLLAAAAIIAAPAMAQEQPAPTADQTAPAPAADPASDPAMQAPPTPTGDTSTTTGSTTTTPPSAPTTGDPVGGYQPSAPPIQGSPAPGATVRFQQAPDPATAYPAPAALEKYPVCKKGQYDKCIQRGGK